MANVLHSSLTTTDLHEPKGVAAATSGQVYVANGAGSGAWTTPVAPTFMQKHIAGLTYSNAADATNDFTILAGSCRDTTNTEDMTLAASITKRIDATWVVGDNQGGLDTGAVGNNTYHIWLIKRPDTGVVDVLFSLSATAPTMPTNYTKKRRIGSFQRISGVNQSINVVETNGGGISVALKSLASNSLTATFAGGDATVTRLPTGVVFSCLLAADYINIDNITMGHGGAGAGVTVSRAGVPRDFQIILNSNTSGQVYAKSTENPGPDSVSVTLMSWIDHRRD